MPDTIPNLWPTEIKVNVQTPYAILSVQAGLLSKVTRGILQGVVETEAAKDKVQHRLVVVAPAFNSYRHTLVVALHDPNLAYPAEVRAEALAKQERRETQSPMRFYDVTVYPKAYDDEQMLRLVGEVLNSQPTRAAILSLIAKSNEAQLSAPAGQAPKTPAAEDGAIAGDSGG